MISLLQTIFFVLLFGASFSTGFQLSARFLPAGEPLLRWCGAVIIQCWILVALFHLLAPFGLFLPAIALPILILAAFGVARITPHGITLFRSDLQQAETFFRTLRTSPVRWIVFAAAGVVGIRFVRSLVAPPLGWDALTYHLPKATLWVQQGGSASLPGPGANTYYAFFHTGGDILWAWTLLPGSDMLLGVTGLLIWSALVLSLTAAARLLQPDPVRAALIAVTIASTPVILQYFSAAYVDAVLLLYLVCALVFLSHWRRTGTVMFAVLACASLGLAFATKITGMFFAVAGIVMICLGMKAVPKAMGMTFLCLAALSVGTPDYLKAWIETGSPFYPFEIKLGQTVLFHGNDHLTALQSGLLHQKESLLSKIEYFRYLFFTTVSPWGHLNFGGGGLMLVLLGLWGTVRGFRHREFRSLTILLLAGFVIGIFPLLLDSAAIYHTRLWAPIVGRLFLPAFAMFALLAGLIDGKWFMAVWASVAAINLYLSFPAGFGRTDMLGLADLLPWLGAGAIAGFVAFRFRNRPWLTVSLITAAILLPLSQLAAIRGEYRYRIYQEAANGSNPAFDVHQLNSHYGSAWPIWQSMDGGEPKKLAVTAGWDGIGHNWYWQPLFGSRLQNELTYVSMTADGSLPDLTDHNDSLERGDFPSWLGRILDAEPDAIVLLAPPPVERDWVEQHPFLFNRLLSTPEGNHLMVRVEPEAARAFLAADTCKHRAVLR